MRLLLALLLCAGACLAVGCASAAPPDAPSRERVVDVAGPLGVDPAGALRRDEISAVARVHADTRAGLRDACGRTRPVTGLIEAWIAYCRDGDVTDRKAVEVIITERDLPRACAHALLVRPPRVPTSFASACPQDGIPGARSQAGRDRVADTAMP